MWKAILLIVGNVLISMCSMVIALYVFGNCHIPSYIIGLMSGIIMMFFVNSMRDK